MGLGQSRPNSGSRSMDFWVLSPMFVTMVPQTVREILRSKAFWQGAGLIWLLQLVILLANTPMYDIDTNSFIRGGLSWDIYHNPFLNLFVAAFAKIWSNLYFLIAIQLAAYAFCAGFLVRVLLGLKGKYAWLGIGIAALEPVSLFYHLSLIAESFYTSFTLLSVAMLIMWLRKPQGSTAFAFGAAMGLTFLTKLSAMIHTPLFGLLLLKKGIPWKTKLLGLALALAPFGMAYWGVGWGQKAINGGGLYTVAGRVRWDFSSSQYFSVQPSSPLFHQFVDPYILPNGQPVLARELRRELSYLGYKDCVAFFEEQGQGTVKAIYTCDSLFGDVADQMLATHAFDAWKQFVSDNFHDLTHLSYIDYRFTPHLHYYHPDHEYQYIDSLMGTHFGVNLAEREHRIPVFWRSLSFGNVYMTIMALLWAIVLIVGMGLWWRQGRPIAWLALGYPLTVAMAFHLFYISYRARFWAPYLVLMLLVGIYAWVQWRKIRQPSARNRKAQP